MRSAIAGLMPNQGCHSEWCDVYELLFERQQVIIWPTDERDPQLGLAPRCGRRGHCRSGSAALQNEVLYKTDCPAAYDRPRQSFRSSNAG
jgi:hypothetical protein